MLRIIVAVLAAVMAAGAVAGPGILKRNGFFQYMAQRQPRMMGLTPMFHDAKESDFSRSSIPDLSGKVALVTGANIGLGLSTVGMLAGEGKMRVIMACRNMQKCREAAAQLEAMGIPKERLDPQYLDLSSLKSVAAFADKIQATEKRLDVVVMNAGLGWQPVDLTEDGIEKIFATNHVGHFLLWKRIKGLVEKTADAQNDARLVVVSSSAHYEAKGVPLSLQGVNAQRDVGGFNAYSESKLANLLFAQQVAEDEASRKLFVNAAHPGLVASNFAQNMPDAISQHLGGIPVIGGPLQTLAKPLLALGRKAVFMTGWQPDDGALTQVYLATSPDVAARDIRGKFYVPIASLQERTSKWAQDSDLQKGLWEFTEKLLAERGY